QIRRPRTAAVIRRTVILERTRPPRLAPRIWIGWACFWPRNGLRRSGASRTSRRLGGRSFGWRAHPIVNLDGGGHAGRKDDARGHRIDMDADWDALCQAHPGEDGVDVGDPLIVGL